LQHVIGKNDPVEVLHTIREMKNSFIWIL
jgi:hypothetical protein